MPKTPRVEMSDVEQYVERLQTPQLRVRLVYVPGPQRSDRRAVVVYQVRLEGGKWVEGFREGEMVPGGTQEGIVAAWFRGLFRLWTRFDGVDRDELAALARWEAGMRPAGGQ